MIHPALIILMQMQGRSWMRRMLRGPRTPRGLIFFILGLSVFLCWLGPSLVGAILAPRSDAGTVRHAAPLVMFAFCLLSLRGSSTGAGVYFTPSEVDFLFAGPFTRRELLIYKLIKAAASSAIVSLFFSIGLLKFVHWWIAAFLGCFLGLTFMTLFSMSVALLAETVSERAYTRARKTFLLGLLAVLVFLMGRSIIGGAPVESGELLRQFEGSWIGLCLLAPFKVIGHVLAAETLVAEMLPWAVAAAAINAGLATLVLWLDTNYLESALATSQRIYARLQQVRRGGSAYTWSTKGTARTRLPQLPYLGGAGPIAWRQLTTALRNSPGFLIMLPIVAGSVGVGVGTVGPPQHLAAALPGFVVWLTFFFTMLLRYDFRGDVDHMDWLKTMPLGCNAIAAGELIAPVVIMSAVQLTLLGAMAGFVAETRLETAVAMAFVVPFNFLLFGLENFFFLLYPIRLQHQIPGDFQSIGRHMIVMMAKMSLLGLCAGVATLPGLLACWLSGWLWPAFALGSWLALALEGAALVPFVAWAYRRFDVAADTPG